jgi:hypothetical protein
LQWVLLPTKTHNTTLLFSRRLLSPFWLLEPASEYVWMRVCYLGCHETGLCCYLVIHIENLLWPLQMFYIHLRPIYCLFLVREISRGLFVLLIFNFIINDICYFLYVSPL